MTIPSDNETWIIETGDEIIRKQASLGRGALSAWERLVYCLWVADYGIRNAGDLATATDVYQEWHTEGLRLAHELHLNRTAHMFSLPTKDLEREYLGLFENVCEELKSTRSEGPTRKSSVRR